MYTTIAAVTLQTAAASQQSLATCVCSHSPPFSPTVLADSRGVITLGVIALVKDLQQQSIPSEVQAHSVGMNGSGDCQVGAIDNNMKEDRHPGDASSLRNCMSFSAPRPGHNDELQWL